MRHKNLQNGLKILIDYPIYGGSLTISDYVTKAFKKKGFNTRTVDNSLLDDFFQKILTLKDGNHKGNLSNSLVNLLSDFFWVEFVSSKPDLVFFNAQSPITINLLKSIKKTKTPIIFWFVEDYRRFEYYKEISRYTDIFLTIQKDDLFEELNAVSTDCFYYLPLAADPDTHRKLNLSQEEKIEFGSDISFMGAAYPNRQHLFSRLLDYDLKLWGSGWDSNKIFSNHVQRKGDRISVENSVKIYNSTKININLHSSLENQIFEPVQDFINPRTFEIMACGGFQLVDKRTLMSEIFTEGQDIISFHSLKDLRNKIDYYLKNDKERNEIAENAREKVLKNHTYEDRIESIMEFASKKFPKLKLKPEKNEKIYERERMVEFLKTKNNHLRIFLDNFPDIKNISLTDLIKTVKKQPGLDISKSIFLFLEQCLKESK